MIVDEIVDVAEEAVVVRKKSDRKGILGSAVVGKRVTDFLDLNEVIQFCAKQLGAETEGEAGGKSVLVADASVFSRGIIRSGLDMAGYVVFEAANLDEAMHRLERHDGRHRGGGAGSSARRQFRFAGFNTQRSAEWENIPVLALANTARQMKSRAVRTAGYEECQMKSDQAQVLESVARLTSLASEDEAIAACAGEEK
jgi:two-component system chemotaxis sensor kinase CheA